MILDDLFINFCILCTTTLGVNWTIRSLGQVMLPAQLAVRAVLTILSALTLVAHAVPVGGGVSLDLRAVPVALATLGGGPAAGLSVAVPLIVQAFWSGRGQGVAVLIALSLVVIITLLFRRRRTAALQRGGAAPWVPVVVFTAANVPLGLGAVVSGLSVTRAVGLVAVFVSVQALGFLAAQAITVAQVRRIQRAETMTTLAYTDPLTGLGNRRALDEVGLTVGAATHVLLLDLDHFKAINDRFGHDAGDRVLIAAAGVLRRVLGPDGGAYRHGGEEFTAVCHQLDDAQVLALAERVRVHVEAQVGPHAGLPQSAVTVSVGVARVGGDLAQARTQADLALYAAKRAGRNQVLMQA